jgi:hypothetical protein
MNDELIEGLVRKVMALQSRVDSLERLEHAMAQNHGYIGGAWQKDPISFGYSAQITGNFSNTNLSAGSNTLSGDTVPAGEIWVITNISVQYSGTVTSVILQAVLLMNSISMPVGVAAPPVSGVNNPFQGWWVLAAGDIPRAVCSNATSGDDMYLVYSGFRVDIDQ